MKRILTLLIVLFTISISAQNNPPKFRKGLHFPNITKVTTADSLLILDGSGIANSYILKSDLLSGYSSGSTDSNIGRVEITSTPYFMLEADILNFKQFIIDETLTDVVITIPQTTLTSDYTQINIYHKGDGDISIQGASGVTPVFETYENAKRLSIFNIGVNAWLVKADNPVASGASTVLEGYSESGTRAGGDLQFYLGDYDESTNGFGISYLQDDKIKLGDIVNGDKPLIELRSGVNNRILFSSEGFSFSDYDAANASNANFEFDNLTLDRVYQFPNAAGTIPLSFTDGSTTVAANNDGLVDISSISGSGGSGTDNYVYQAWVAKTGSDTNDGSKSSPFLTINKALEGVDGRGRKVVVKEGDYYETLDLDSCEFGDVTLVNYKTDKVRIMGSALIAGITKTSGRTSIYEAPFTDTIDATGDNAGYGYRIFEDNVESLEIPFNERHALQRSQNYRLPYSVIKRIDDQGSLTANLDYLDNLGTDESGFWNDGTNIYIVNAAHGDVSASDIHYAVRNNTNTTVGESTNDRYNTDLTIRGIDFYYSNDNGLDLYRFGKTNLFQVAVFGARVHGLVQLLTQSEVTMVEVGGCGKDGINTLNYFGSTNKERQIEKFNTYTNIWCHDSEDDGFSHHSNGVVNIENFLFEYNTDTGFQNITSSYNTISNGVAQKNGKGIVINGGEAAATDRNSTTLEAYNVLSKDNNINFESGATATSRPAIMNLYNCISRNASQYGYRADGVNEYINLHNCKANNDVLAVSGDGISVYNDEMVNILATSVSITPATSSTAIGVDTQLTATPTPANTSEKGVWASSDESVGTVDQNGLFTSVSGGTTNVSFTYNDSDTTGTSVMTVTSGSYGSELVMDNGMDGLDNGAGVYYWIANGGSSLSDDGSGTNNVGKLISAAGSLSSIYQNDILTIGTNYILTFDITYNPTGAVKITDGGGYFASDISGVGAKSITFTATGTNIKFDRNSGVTEVWIDNVSIKEVL